MYTVILNGVPDKRIINEVSIQTELANEGMLSKVIHNMHDEFSETPLMPMKFLMGLCIYKRHKGQWYMVNSQQYKTALINVK